MIYLYWYLAVTLIGLFPLFIWYTYLTSSDHVEYRYLTLGELLGCLIGSVFPIVNLFGLYSLIRDAIHQGFLSRFLNIKVFGKDHK